MGTESCSFSVTDAEGVCAVFAGASVLSIEEDQVLQNFQ
jgi:hypothetical protein